MQQPTSAPLGLQDLEHGAALAKTQGSLQASQILIASPAFGRNPPQVDSARIRQPMLSVKAIYLMHIMHIKSDSSISDLTLFMYLRKNTSLPVIFTNSHLSPNLPN
jgi:hypothetical protein